MFKRKLNKKISSCILITSLLIILLVSTLTASAKLMQALTPLGLTRPIITGSNGGVTSGHPLSSQAGLQILMKGGNAIDAAVAVASTLHVVEYGSSGLDGVGFATIYWAPENKVYNVSMTGAVPYAMDLDPATSKDELSIGYKAGCVPGIFGGWVEALQKFGTMSLKEVMESAINYAENGFPLSDRFVSAVERNKTNFELYPSSARFWLPNGRVPEVGEMFYMKDLANTFKKLVDAEQLALKQGKSRVEALQAAFDRFYKGDIAQEVARFYAENGGYFTLKDLADYKPFWDEPLHINYRGYDVYISPSSSRTGYEVCMQANLIEGFDLQAIGHNSAEYLHLVTECIKLAKADIYHYVADNRFVEIPTEAMLSKEYAAVRRELIDPDKAMVYPGPGIPEELKAVAQGLVPVYSTASQIIEEGYDPMVGTTSFSIIDPFGNVLACTPTHGSTMGTRVVVGNTGMTFNNGTRVGSIAPYPDNVNAIEGGKRSLLGNGPAIVMKDGKFFAAFGTPGGEGIGQDQFQVLLNLIDFGMGMQEATEASTIRLRGNPDFYVPGAEIEVRMEATFPEEVIKEFEAKGHKISVRTSGIGSLNGILMHPEFGTWTIGSSPNREAYAVAW